MILLVYKFIPLPSTPILVTNISAVFSSRLYSISACQTSYNVIAESSGDICQHMLMTDILFSSLVICGLHELKDECFNQNWKH